jgi:hypothetical protein
MEDKIEVGEYIRDKAGNIALVKKNHNDIFEIELNSGRRINMYIEFVVKHSKNIIDLIEVGDYVNGVKVIDIGAEIRDCKCAKTLYMLSDMEIGWANTLFEEHISSIVTKEQFSEIEYKVEEDK